MAQGDPRKWHLPGWRIEQRFSQGVLIGNWSEERNVFNKGNTPHNSTHRIDFRNFGSHRPDVVIRRSARLKNEGIGQQNLFYHHGNRYSNNMVSWYDEHYNGRWRENTLPDLRTWNSHELSWAPEKSDYPLQGSSTNYGLYQKLQNRWSDQIADETRGDFTSTYTSSYNPRSASGLVTTRFANPRENSTTLHKYNHTNKDLGLRQVSSVKSPEKLPGDIPLVSC
ncbi:uncharacterized protein C1orf158 homolog [Haliotis rubra]|uniref:uncharacterized protein C1orf158 homolog n=1 Tax=Haliotis rubra TaxID=36100 RepID=UPI001EE633CC|nr:uncharacterized protein C1orf158 homolog [Haliotis rubra]